MKYTIEERNINPKYGKLTIVHNPLLDGPIEPYIKSEHYIVRDEVGKEISQIAIRNNN